ncbi:MAG: DUF433 domain-containing protein [Pyrinomonadaceae bacterium]
MKEYIEKRGEGYYVTGSRVSLDSIIYSFWSGESPEAITQSFPTLVLEQVYGAIAFYLAHREEIDEYISRGEVEFEKMRQEARTADPMFYQKMARARRQSQADAA